MRQVVNAAKGGPMLGHSTCMAMKDMDTESDSLDVEMEETVKTMGNRHQVEKERRMRREIANSNERRRMQSINMGYQKLKNMLPVKDGGEKLSKAAVLQHAAEYMVQLLDDRKQLMLQNSELTKALNSMQNSSQPESLAAKRRKRDTESSDEGISMAYHPVQSHYDSDVIEDMRREVAELRVQLEREKQRNALMEQTYTYSIMAAKVAQQQQVATSAAAAAVNSLYHQQAMLSPSHSRLSSSDDLESTTSVYTMYSNNTKHEKDVQSENQSYGKASSVASQNLSIIVEAINHLEGDQERQSMLEKHDTDSGMSHGESSDEGKSDCSRTDTPQPPPAHQSNPATVLSHQHHLSAAYNMSSYNASPISLVYRPTFISSMLSQPNATASALNHQTNGVVISSNRPQ